MKHSSKSPKKLGKRPLGMFRGEIWMAPDFDVPMKLVDDLGETELTPEPTSAARKKGKRGGSGKKKT